MTKGFLAAVASLLALLMTAGAAGAHGLAGKRFFPSTIAIDDPFVSDELTLPSILHIRRPASGEEPATNETTFSGEFSKRITPDFGFSLGGELTHLDPDEGDSVTGFGNLEVGLKYQFFKSAEHEAILSAGLSWEVGGTGSKKIGAESFDVVTPGLFFGKGFGDLPDAVAFLKPFALTGQAGVAIPTRSSPNVFTWGLALEYSIPYLESFVKDLGLPGPFRQLIPLVEVEFQHPLDRGHTGEYTGTVNPGIVWAGKFFQVGIEAVFPVNDRTGKNVGIRGMLHFFLDDLFPKSIGRPLFGN
jgi:hypothetical protein